MTKTVCGCTASLENRCLTLKNALVERCFEDVDSISVKQEDNQGCSAPFMEVRAVVNGEERVYQMWEDLPMIRISPSTEEYLMRIKGAHWTVRSIKLRAFTDDSELLLEDKTEPTLRTGIKAPIEGNFFFLEDVETGDAILILSEAPDYIHGKLRITQGKPRFAPGEDRGGGYIQLKNGGNPVAIGFCRMGECEELCRNYYRHVNRRRALVTMSNTWGDAHGRDCVCHDFVMKEIDAAREIGVDIVQIDDGWQCNATKYASPRDAEGFRAFSREDSWEINDERFPEGLKPVVDYAARDGIRVGMWMAPYSWNEFEYFKRDCEVLKKAYNEWGIRFFKLDMYQVTSRLGQDRLLEILRTIYSLGDDVSVQMDVTRHDRLNYLCGTEYGTIFVENRYTELANSFPHRVLRHQWKIGRFIPVSRFQFELVNPDLNREFYNEGDPFVPSLFTMDYLFAAVMLGNPLFWMEMQFLSEKRREELAPLMAIWKQHRDALAKGDVCPIGEQPSGRSLTGFSVCLDGKPEYLLLFREVTDRENGLFVVPGLDAKSSVEVLASNADVTLTCTDGAVGVQFSKERTYAFVKVNG